MTDQARLLLSMLIAAFVLALGFAGGAKAQQPEVTVEREAYTGPAIVVRDMPEPPRFASAADIEAALTVFDWATPPSGDLPEIAAQLGITRGEAELVCQVSGEGTLSECLTVSENPGGVGFAAEAERAAGAARVRQMAYGRSVRFRLIFQPRVALQPQVSSSF
ncbi:MAG: hypothetical protein K2X61_01285 [Caulobacteraceae bacterium]|nr:hypothetical protein [Caulobacteraceae bacterium]